MQQETKTISLEDAYLIMNTSAMLFALDSNLTKLSHTTYYRHMLKKKTNDLAKELQPIIEKDVQSLFDACEFEMTALDENVHTFIHNSLTTKPEDWQLVMFAQEICKNKDTIFYGQLETICKAFYKYKNDKDGSK